jgi:hypothetical protein
MYVCVYVRAILNTLVRRIVVTTCCADACAATAAICQSGTPEAAGDGENDERMTTDTKRIEALRARDTSSLPAFPKHRAKKH